MAETKPKNNASLRTPQPKKKFGLSVPPALRMPHEDLISTPADDTDKATMTSQTSHSSQTSQTSHSKQNPDSVPVSPVRDYTKVANSIGREAVPAGIFTGKSKQLYDCLYSLTRGALVPSRTIRISRPKLMKKSGIGARVTFDTNVERLVAVGLIQVRKIAGEHKGNEYAVFLPEEISMARLTSQTTMTSQTSHAQKLVRLVSLETSQTSQGLSVENTDSSGEPKTFLKTKYRTDDDEAFAKLAAVLKNAVREVTGKDTSVADSARWGELAELLVTELKIAAARTAVSNVPAFLTEHLRRRLWKVDKRQGREEAAESEETKRTTDDSARHCADCGGTGFYYPQGYEGGVAKCRHERAVQSKEGDEK